MSQHVEIRPFQKSDSHKVIEFISDIIVNEFKFKLEFDTLDSDILAIDESYNKSNGSCFWVAETVVNDDYSNTHQQKQKILGTTAVRNLKQFESTCELKRMYVSSDFRRLGLGQKLLNIAVDFAKSVGYSRMVLDTLPRCCKSSFERNSPSSLDLTILYAALVPNPGIELNGGINVFPSIINSEASDLYKS